MQDSGVELLVDCMGFLVRVLFPGSRESKPRLKAGKQSCQGRIASQRLWIWA